MKCHVLGDKLDCNTINVLPGDIVTFDWHHDNRTTSDDIIAGSHVGPCLIYISPDPPTDNSWVKLWHQARVKASSRRADCTEVFAFARRVNMAIISGARPTPWLTRKGS